MRSDQTKVISFSGIDGAGKSTQIEALQCYLRDLGFHPVLYTFWDNIVVFPRMREQVSFKAFGGDKGVGSPENPILRRDKNVSSWYVTAFRLLLYLLDAFRLRWAISNNTDHGADFIIVDRYIYDELANLPLDHPVVLTYVRLLLRFIPRPDAAFLLDADPQAAHTRKPEYPLEFAGKNRDSFISLSRLIPGMMVLDPLPIEQTTARIKASIARHCLRTDSAGIDLPLRSSTSSCRAKNP